MSNIHTHLTEVFWRYRDNLVRKYAQVSPPRALHVSLAFPAVEFFKLDVRAKVPERKNQSDAGYDLYTLDDMTLEPHSFTDVHTGISIKMPEGVYWARITGRSSTVRTWKLQIQEGVIDSGYTGEMFIGIWNLNDDWVLVPAGTRLAQLIFHINLHVSWVESDEPLSGERGNNGFGSTGT